MRQEDWKHFPGKEVVVWKVTITRKNKTEVPVCRGKFVCFRRGWFYIDCGSLFYQAFPQRSRFWDINRHLAGACQDIYLMQEPRDEAN